MIEKVGRGTVLITELFDENGLDAPQWKSKNGGTTLVLSGKPKSIELNSRMIAFLKQINHSLQFSREDYQNYFVGKISEKTARNDIAKLLEGNWLEKLGDGPQTKYLQTSKKLPDIAG
jgi:predicted HTH transcriptional regulator